MNSNPLSQYFRQPVLHLKLPSGGRFWPEGSLDLPATGEVPVYPMTAKDEIGLKTPDALLNGSATVEVIQSCIPAIKDAWKMPVSDLDAVLIAIRNASYGDEIEFTSVCPSCRESNEYTLNIHEIQNNADKVNWDNPVVYNDLRIYLKPQSYYELNRTSIENFEEQRLIQLANNSDLPEDEKIRQFNEIFRKLTTQTIKTIAANIDRIETETDSVNNPLFIQEFVENAERSVFDAIRKQVSDVRERVQSKPLHIKCDSCTHEYETPFQLEQSNFFG